MTGDIKLLDFIHKGDIEIWILRNTNFYGHLKKILYKLQTMSSGYLIINILDNTALIIEDDSISDAVVNEMLRNNCKISQQSLATFYNCN